jgi:WD40 repeat protein
MFGVAAQLAGEFVFAAELMGHSGAVRCCCAMPGTAIATGGLDNTVRLWDLASCAPTAVLRGHSTSGRADGGVLAVACTQLELLASAGRDGDIILWAAAAEEGDANGEGSGGAGGVAGAGGGEGGGGQILHKRGQGHRKEGITNSQNVSSLAVR